MSKINDGGPAFPRSASAFDAYGMSLRDWFAGKALAAYGAPFNEDETRRDVASRCYEMADAMLAERSKSGGSDA